jgi:hypothetical protein
MLLGRVVSEVLLVPLLGDGDLQRRAWGHRQRLTELYMGGIDNLWL